jgi:hypothetical protein
MKHTQIGASTELSVHDKYHHKYLLIGTGKRPFKAAPTFSTLPYPTPGEHRGFFSAPPRAPRSQIFTRRKIHEVYRPHHPLGIGTPPWPTYEPLQVKYFKRLAPNGANGQVVTHSNHIGTHLDGEIHFYTPGKDIASLDFDFLAGEAAIVDLSDICGDYDIYTPEMIEERVEVRQNDILIIHTGYHHFGWDQPTATKCATWSCTPAPTTASPTGARTKSSNG